MSIKKTYVIITAAGRGRRMGLATPKQFLKLGKMTVLERTLGKFLSFDQIEKIILVCQGEDFPIVKDLVKDSLSRIELVEGGSSREESTLRGLEAIENEDSFVITHDSARPFVKKEMVEAILEKLEEGRGYIYAIEETDSVKLVEGGKVKSNLDRSKIFRIQTPQGFYTKDLKEALETHLGKEGLTDDSSYTEAQGIETRVLKGSIDNFKITNERDLILARALAEEEDNEDR